MKYREPTAEFLGTFLLVTTVVGSGIMAEDLSQGNTATALLANAIATGATLYVIITIFGPISGAHFNPVVTLVMFFRRQISSSKSIAYVVFQILGGICGTVAAHLMFELPVLQFSTTARTGLSQFFSEVIATFGLLLTILFGVKHKIEAVPTLVALYITAAYWFTASTSFANPSVTIARTFSDTFSGINYNDTGIFIVAQILGAVLALILYGLFDKDA
ncbi:MAG: MIP/aquaporin family protein [Alphaproteobacteria bacterium]